MTMWTAILLAAVICVASKLIGYLVPTVRLERGRSARVIDLLTVAFLGALVAVQTVGSGMAVTIDARLPALMVAGTLLWLRASFVIVVIGAATVAALLRLLGWSA